jgi:hypothetical protein
MSEAPMESSEVRARPSEIELVRSVLAWHQTAYARFHNGEGRGVIEANDMAIGYASVELAKALAAAATPSQPANPMFDPEKVSPFEYNWYHPEEYLSARTQPAPSKDWHAELATPSQPPASDYICPRCMRTVPENAPCPYCAASDIVEQIATWIETTDEPLLPIEDWKGTKREFGAKVCRALAECIRKRFVQATPSHGACPAAEWPNKFTDNPYGMLGEPTPHGPRVTALVEALRVMVAEWPHNKEVIGDDVKHADWCRRCAVETALRTDAPSPAKEQG